MTATAAARLKTLDLVYISLFAVLMAICSWISIPAALPFTLQTFGVFLTASLLGPKRAAAVVLIYLLLGLVGLPVFASFTAGPGKLLGPTGGYLTGFLLAAPVIGLISRLSPKVWAMALGMLVGLFLCYSFGTAWFMIVYARTSGTVGLATALGWCVIPFIIPDLLKLLAACALSKRLRPYLK